MAHSILTEKWMDFDLFNSKRWAFVIVFTVVILAASSGQASASGGGFYVAGKAGLGVMDATVSMDHNQTAGPSNAETKSANSNFSYGAAIGWNWLDSGLPIRTELEYYDHGSFEVGYSDSNATFNSSADIQTVQLNLFYDFHNDTSFIPYVGGGVGFASMKGTNTKSSTNFSYSLFAGTGYELTENLLLDVVYRVNQFGDVQIDWSDTNNAYQGKVNDVYCVEGVLGLRYQF